MKFLGKAFFGLFLASLTLALLGIAGNSVRNAVVEQMNEEPRERPRREQTFVVNVIEFLPQTVAPTITTFGRIQSGRTLELRIKRSGQITNVADEFVEGGFVRAGQTLIQTDDIDEKSALERTKVEYDVAQSEIQNTISTVDFAERDVEVARQQALLQQRALTRQKDLVARGVGTTAAIENAEFAVASAEQSLLSKERTAAQALSALAQAEHRVKLAQLAQEEAMRALEDTKVIAEFDAVLSGITTVSGGLVNANEQIGSLIDPSRLEVEFRVSNAQFARLLNDDGNLIQSQVRIILKLQDFEIDTTGTITRESAVVADGQTGRLLFAQLDPAGARQLRPGDFVTVEISEPEIRGVAKLPSTAVDSQGTVLIVGEENRLDVASVNVLRRAGNDVLVRSRELVGQQIVAERTPLLGAGILVSPLAPGGEEIAEPTEPAEIELSEERRQKLIAAVESNNRMPADVKGRMLDSLKKPTVPARMVERIESRIGRGG